jgi:hypothetical protein
MCLSCRYVGEDKREEGYEAWDTELIATQRNLNNCFAYDLVPSPSVLTAALRAARRVNDFPSAVRVFEGMYNIHQTVPSPHFPSHLSFLLKYPSLSATPAVRHMRY